MRRDVGENPPERRRPAPVPRTGNYAMSEGHLHNERRVTLYRGPAFIATNLGRIIFRSKNGRVVGSWRGKDVSVTLLRVFLVLAACDSYSAFFASRRRASSAKRYTEVNLDAISQRWNNRRDPSTLLKISREIRARWIETRILKLPDDRQINTERTHQTYSIYDGIGERGGINWLTAANSCIDQDPSEARNLSIKKKTKYRMYKRVNV